MTKMELIAKVAEKAEITKAAAEKAVNATLSTITDALCEGDKVAFVGFGTFEVHERAARTGRNPQTGAEMIIPACKVPSFKAGKALKAAVNA
jgi:DNA-binding protein HU-beta